MSQEGQPLLPPEVWARVQPLAISMVVFYAMQTVVFRYAALNANFVVRIITFVWFCSTMCYLAIALRSVLGPYYSFNVNLAWWLFALIFAKHVHALLDPQSLIETVGLCCPPANDHHKKNEGNDKSTTTTTTLTKSPPTAKDVSWVRLFVFCYCPATVLFENSTIPPSPSTTKRSVIFYVIRGFIQMAVMSQVAQAILTYHLYDKLPLFIQNWMAFYQICLSQGGFSDLFMAAPTQYMLQQSSFSPNVRVIEPSDAPALSTHPRYFWNRWSKSVGTIHFRHSLYERNGGYAHQYWATAVTFGCNTLFHVFFWGPCSTEEGRFAWNYVYVLSLAPAVGLLMDHHVWKPLRTRYGKAVYVVGNWVTLQVLAALLFNLFLDAQGMPTNLKDLALLQTGRL